MMYFWAYDSRMEPKWSDFLTYGEKMEPEW